MKMQLLHLLSSTLDVSVDLELSETVQLFSESKDCDPFGEAVKGFPQLYRLLGNSEGCDPVTPCIQKNVFLLLHGSSTLDIKRAALAVLVKLRSSLSIFHTYLPTLLRISRDNRTQIIATA